MDSIALDLQLFSTTTLSNQASTDDFKLSESVTQIMSVGFDSGRVESKCGSRENSLSRAKSTNENQVRKSEREVLASSKGASGLAQDSARSREFGRELTNAAGTKTLVVPLQKTSS